MHASIRACYFHLTQTMIADVLAYNLYSTALHTTHTLSLSMQALLPSIKRDFPSEETCPMQYFIARVYRNLRVVLCLPPTAPLLAHTAQ